MIRQRLFRYLLIFYVVWVPVFADGMDKNQMVQELIIKSGIQEQIQQIPLGIQYSLRQQPQLSQLPDKELERLDRAISESFDPQVILGTIQQKFYDDLSTKEIETVLNWLNSPLGIRITQLEKESSKPGAKEDSASSIQSLLSDPDAPDRLKLIQRVDKATRLTDITTDMVLNMQISMILALNSLAPPEQQKSYEEIAELVNKQRSSVKEMLSQQTITGTLYTYRDLSNAEFEQYIAFIESEAGLKYHDISLKALSEAMITASRKYGEKLGMMSKEAQKPSQI